VAWNIIKSIWKDFEDLNYLNLKMSIIVGLPAFILMAIYYTWNSFNWILFLIGMAIFAIVIYERKKIGRWALPLAFVIFLLASSFSFLRL